VRDYNRGEVHGHFVAGGGVVERQQVTAVGQHADASSVFEWTGRIIWADERCIDRNRVREATIDCTANSAFSPEPAGLDEAVTLGIPAVLKINGIDHAVAIHWIGVVDRLEKRIRPLRI
jgi:hypothetical protein